MRVVPQVARGSVPTSICARQWGGIRLILARSTCECTTGRGSDIFKCPLRIDPPEPACSSTNSGTHSMVVSSYSWSDMGSGSPELWSSRVCGEKVSRLNRLPAHVKASATADVGSSLNHVSTEIRSPHKHTTLRCEQACFTVCQGLRNDVVQPVVAAH